MKARIDINLLPEVWYGFRCADLHETRSHSAAPMNISSTTAHVTLIGRKLSKTGEIFSYARM
jgi:hypothetical protein